MHAVAMTSQPTNESELQLYRVLQRANLLSYYDTFICQGCNDIKEQRFNQLGYISLKKLTKLGFTRCVSASFERKSLHGTLLCHGLATPGLYDLTRSHG
ncbi:UNVERIFIED_CONTAM: nab [Trichonephila clavipes]